MFSAQAIGMDVAILEWMIWPLTILSRPFRSATHRPFPWSPDPFLCTDKAFCTKHRTSGTFGIIWTDPAASRLVLFANFTRRTPLRWMYVHGHPVEDCPLVGKNELVAILSITANRPTVDVNCVVNSAIGLDTFRYGCAYTCDNCVSSIPRTNASLEGCMANDTRKKRSPCTT